LYVGRIWVEKAVGLKAVVLLLNPGDPGGSYWQFFDTWTADDRKAALSMLTAAKLAGHRVNLATSAADGCSIGVTGFYVQSVYLANNP
jgi:hypothetical protein